MADTLSKDIELLETKRKEALSRCDAVSYRDLCIQLGIEPEDRDLIDVATSEQKMAQLREEQIFEGIREQAPRRTNNNRRRANPQKYRAFLQNALNCKYTDFARDVEYKRRVLQMHFPGRYSRQGMDGYEDVKLGAVFKHLIDDSRRIVSRE